MAEASKRIVVAGDVTVDWLMYPVNASDEGENWRLYNGMHSDVFEGGALLLKGFLSQCLQFKGVSADVIGQQLPGSLKDISPEQIIHSNATLEHFSGPGKKTKAVLRVREPLGYIGPKSGPTLDLSLASNPEHADIIVLDDAGNAFRNQENSWPKALESSSKPIVVYKMARPLACGKLWNGLKNDMPEALVVLVNADDIRRIEGVNISSSLSWERTAKDFVFQILRSDALNAMRACPYLVVLFGTDGAILYSCREGGRSTLIFDPRALEGGFASGIDGGMIGLTSIFTAALVSELAKEGLSGLKAGIKQGLACSRALLEAGYEKTKNGIEYPIGEVVKSLNEKLPFVACAIEPPDDLQGPDPRFWRILDRKTRNTLRIVAEDIVVRGKAKGLQKVSIGAFGNLEAIDRAEIESYSAIKELIIEFMENPRPSNPLCFAVFGPPGSGKSFGVKQVLKSLSYKHIEARTFNISQFGDYRDLVAAFHDVRDIGLAGKLPFVFFDEFDSSFGDEPLGWLKYFLAPMQDGEFKDGESTHPVGKAIFVFAGGTRSSFGEFASNMPVQENSLLPEGNAEADPSSVGTAKKAFRNAKGPDFVSRLRGFINVMGPNRQGKDDDAYIIRRAKMLRVMLGNAHNAGGLYDSRKTLRIDSGLLRAMLHIREYKHGTRSIQAIIDMSRLAGKKRFGLSALPSKTQLSLHVDADEFMFLTERERYHTLFLPMRDLWDPGEPSIQKNENAIVEKVARLIHEDFERHRIIANPSGSPVVSFDELSESKRKGNLDAAEDIPHKLRVIRHGMRKIPENAAPRTPDISDEEVEKLAELEHERWCTERRFQGWRYGKRRDDDRKLSPYLIPYGQLSEDIKQYDREAVCAIPMILKTIGYEIYRMEEVEEFDDPHMVERLARVLHAAYVAEREKEGDKPEDNPSMVAYEELSDDLKAANLDNASTIPGKLKAIGYGIRRLQPGQNAGLLELNDDQIEIMAKMEHARWNWQKILQGWVYKDGDKDIDNRTTPHLVPWEKLPEAIKDYDRQPVSLIPKLLEHAGYEAYLDY